jgi:hypothetical protein
LEGVNSPAVERGRRFERSSRRRFTGKALAVLGTRAWEVPPELCRDAAVDTNCGTKGEPDYCTLSCSITHSGG